MTQSGEADHVGRARQRFVEAQTALLNLTGVHATSRLLVTDGPARHVHVLDTGSGPAVLFVIGGAYSGVAWAPLAAEMHGYRCLLVDRPTFGLTDHMSHRGDGRASAAAFISSILDALELEDVLLVGNSQGGLWSLEFALRHPERTAALALVGCPAVFLGSSAPVDQRLRFTPVIGPLYARVRGVPDRPDERAGVEPATQAALEGLRAAIAGLPGTREETRRVVRSVVGPWGSRRSARFGADRAAQIRVPTLFVWGTEDRNGGPSWGLEAVTLIPDARLHVLRGGHNPWFQQPRATASALRAFLDEAAE